MSCTNPASMDVGMVFGIIFAAIFIGLLLVFGTGQITDLFCLSNDAVVQKALKDMDRKASELYSQSEGSSDSFDLRLPGDAKICFIDPENPTIQDIEPAIQQLIKNNGYNVWYFHCNNAQDGFKMRRLKVESNFCTDGSDDIYFENRGSYVTAQAQ